MVGIILGAAATSCSFLSFSAFSFSAFSFSSLSFCASSSFLRLASRIFIIACASRSCFSHLENDLWRWMPLVLSVKLEIDDTGLLGAPLKAEETRAADEIRLLEVAGFWKGLIRRPTALATDWLRPSPFALDCGVPGGGVICRGVELPGVGAPEVAFQRRSLPATGAGSSDSRVGVSGSADSLSESCHARSSWSFACRYSSSVSQVSMQTWRFA